MVDGVLCSLPVCAIHGLSVCCPCSHSRAACGDGVRLLDGHGHKIAAIAAGHDPTIASLVNLIESSAHAVVTEELLQCVLAIVGRDDDGVSIADAINDFKLLHDDVSSLMVDG